MRPLTSRPPTLGDLIDQADSVGGLLRVADDLGRMSDVPESHRLGDDLLHQLVRILVARHLPKHPDSRAALEILRRDRRRDKWFTAK